MLNDAPNLILITSTRWPYLRDIVDIMFLQSGLGYRFRYRCNYVSPEFIENPEKLVNRKGYIVHAHTRQNPSPEPDTIFEFLPIREATIKEVKQFGEFIWLYFEVGDWVSYLKDDVQSLNEHHASIFNSTPERCRNSLCMTLYEAPGLSLDTITDYPPGQLAEVTANWIRIAKQMARFEPHKNVKPTYFKLISIKAANCENPTMPKTFSETERGYEFKSDTDYRIEIFQYYPHGVPSKPFPLRLVVDEKRVVSLVGEAKVLGMYDLLVMSFRPSPTLRSYGTLLKFEANSESEVKLSITLYAKVKRGWRQLAAALAVAAGIGLASSVSTLGQGTLGLVVALALGFSATVLGFIGFYWSGPRD